MVVIIDYVFDVLVAGHPVGHCGHPVIKWDLLKYNISFSLRYWSSGYALGALCHLGIEHDARLCVR